MAAMTNPYDAEVKNQCEKEGGRYRVPAMVAAITALKNAKPGEHQDRALGVIRVLGFLPRTLEGYLQLAHRNGKHFTPRYLALAFNLSMEEINAFYTVLSIMGRL